MDRINNQKTNFFLSRSSRSKENVTNNDTQLNVEDSKKSAVEAMNSIHQQRNTVKYDFSHFDSDNDDNKGLKFLA
ncbi:MAG: hypothetical protein RLZZ361_249 [Cyanobacteriota bacterium]